MVKTPAIYGFLLRTVDPMLLGSNTKKKEPLLTGSMFNYTTLVIYGQIMGMMMTWICWVGFVIFFQWEIHYLGNLLMIIIWVKQ